MDTTYIIGHKNPDTDATVSPIIAAWYFNNYVADNAYIPLVQNAPNKEAIFVLKKLGIELPAQQSSFKPGTKLIIVDTTNPDELFDTSELEIVGIYDHHKLGGLKTSKPLEVIVQPVGSTATVLYQYFSINGITKEQIPADIAGLIASSIISDTLNLKSPTATKIDREVLSVTAEIAGISDIDGYAQDMFEAKSDISDLTPEQIITYDSKEYTFGNQRVLIGVFETVKPEKLFEKYVELAGAIEKLKQEKGYNHIFFFVIDVLEQTGYYLVQQNPTDKYIKEGFGVQVTPTDRFVELKGVVSRKKQIVPVLEKIVV